MNASVRQLEDTGLLVIGSKCEIPSDVTFLPTDLQGVERPIVIGDGCRVASSAVICGGAVIGQGVVLEESVVVGKPEYGYAVGHVHKGAGAQTLIGDGAVLRGSAVVYASTSIGANTTIGHNATIRSEVTIGTETQLAHNLVVERKARIGDYVRCSPLSHITSEVVLEDRVFLGAGVITINDKAMVWRDAEKEVILDPPYFEEHAKVGSGTTVAASVRVGRHALIGSGSLVLRSVPAFAIAFGVPATIRGDVRNSE